MIETNYTFKSDKGEIYIKSWNPSNELNKPPVFLIHDSLGCVGLWKDLPKTIAEVLQREVIAYDRLGFGKSSKFNGKPKLDFIYLEASEYFPAVKKYLSIENYLLFGHSIGGSMAIEIASRDKDCLGIITESAQAFVEDKTINGIKEAKKLFKNEHQKKRLMKWHGDKTDWILSAWIDVWLSDDFSNWSLENSIHKVNCPVLAIHGENDEYGSNAFPEFIANKSTGESEIFIISDCGHVPHREKQSLVINKVKEFLNKHSL